MSALLWRRPPYRLLETIRERPHLQLYSSAVLLEELSDVLSPPVATKRLALIGKTHRKILSAYFDVIELAEPTETPRVLRDPDDDHVITAALAASAELIVTRDDDLLSLKAYERISIITAAAALRRIQAQQ